MSYDHHTKCERHGEVACPSCMAYEIGRLRAEVEKRKKDREYAQTAVDRIVHYRNLAIVLGATPEQMPDEDGRRLCREGIDRYDTGNGYHASVQDMLDEATDQWAIIDRIEAEVERLKADRRKLAERVAYRAFMQGQCLPRDPTQRKGVQEETEAIIIAALGADS